MDDRSTETVGATDESAGPRQSFRLAPGTRITDRYSVIEVLGSGGSAVVYAVRDAALRIDVALKLLRNDRADDAALERLRREVALTRSASHPHLVRIHDIGQSEHGPFLTMEAAGQTLRDAIKKGPMTVDGVLEIAEQVLQGLSVIHELGIIHRDIKPSNILIAADGTSLLADFGLALQLHAAESRLTRTDAIVGTYEYIAPEQALGRPVDARADLYAFGVVMFEMLTGQLPFERQAGLATAIAHIQGRTPSTRRLRRDVPGWLARFVARLLEKDPANRYQSARDALEALRSRRVGWRPRQSAFLVLIAATALSLAVWRHFATQFDHAEIDGQSLVGISRAGPPIWHLPFRTSTDRYLIFQGIHGKTVALIPGATVPTVAAQTANHTLAKKRMSTCRTRSAMRREGTARTPQPRHYPPPTLRFVQAIPFSSSGRSAA